MKTKKLPKYTGFVSTKVGKVVVVLQDSRITSLNFTNSVGRASTNRKDPLFNQVVFQLNKYFSDPAWQFELPLDLHGTDLQKKIWRALIKIPYGTVVSYGDVAKQIGTSPRVVGNACRRNPLPIIIPCHRVVAARGIGGYCGNLRGALKIKEWLLNHEAGLHYENKYT